VYETSTRQAHAKNDPIAIRRRDCVESANCRIGAAHTPTRRARIEAERDGAPESIVTRRRPRGVKRTASKRSEGVGIDDVTASIH
jgi:hypothetical protein